MSDAATPGPDDARQGRIRDFYDRRVLDPDDLNTRCAAGARPAHHHCGLLRAGDPVPPGGPERLAWLYRSEERLCDWLWSVVDPLLHRDPAGLLDLGCGEGGTLARLSALAGVPEPGCWGVTLSPEQAGAVLRALPAANVRVGDMLACPGVPPAAFDLVVAIESTEYIGEPNLPRLFRRVAGWLAPGGIVALVAGDRADGAASSPDAVRGFDDHYRTDLSRASAYREAARAAGLAAVAEVDLGPATIPYWEVRAAHPDLRNSPDGRVESMIAQGLRQGTFGYRLYAWQAGTGRGG